jgi:hypothetical protein
MDTARGPNLTAGPYFLCSSICTSCARRSRTTRSLHRSVKPASQGPGTWFRPRPYLLYIRRVKIAPMSHRTAVLKDWGTRRSKIIVRRDCETEITVNDLRLAVNCKAPMIFQDHCQDIRRRYFGIIPGTLSGPSLAGSGAPENDDAPCMVCQLLNSRKQVAEDRFGRY